MHDPELRPGAGREKKAAAWFTFPPSIVVDIAMVDADGEHAELESLFAHELGHHVLAPSTRIDSLKILHQLGRALVASGLAVDAEKASYLSNLWCDLLVNARVGVLQRARAAEATEASDAGEPVTGEVRGIVRRTKLRFRIGFDAPDRLWWVYRRAYELLWSLPPGTLCPVAPPPLSLSPSASVPGSAALSPERPLDEIPERFREKEQKLRAAREEARRVAAQLAEAARTRPEFDADLIAGFVRTFADDPVAGALRFGVVTAPYLLESAAQAGEDGSGRGKSSSRGNGPGSGSVRGDGDGFGGCAADDAPPTGDELSRVLADRRLHGEMPDRSGRMPSEGGEAPPTDAAGLTGGQGFGLADTLALFPTADADAVYAAWYRAAAAPWVKPITERRPAKPAAELPGPIELWDAGDELADLDWASTMQAGATIIPGVTTRKRSYLDDEPELDEASVDLDLYIDSSGSMPSPAQGSPAVLAGTILALSVLRGGGRVRVTSFSGPGQVAGSSRFTRGHAEVVAGLALFYGGGTSFPLDLYGERYAKLAPPREGERRHVVVLSDDGLSSMFGVGNEPYADVARDVRAKLTTATLVLLGRWAGVNALAVEAGYDVRSVASMNDAPRVCAELAEVLHG
ncbi:VWA domain-containing protein [Agromyces protaetiae]|uniref:VWA domain-containing protein n=1 Tax=Agromyces protaetiae TaxID=2509455 RepID=UPI001FB7593C|nr:VWA domain-containing protein [Agromyces protaetiae]